METLQSGGGGNRTNLYQIQHKNIIVDILESTYIKFKLLF